MKRLLILLALLLLPGIAQAQSINAPALSVKGPNLAPAVVRNAASPPLQITVPLNGDQPLATYVFARFGNNQPLQRNAEGFWIDWSGEHAALIDNRFAAQGGSLTFKILDEDISAAYFPVDIFVAYRTGDAFKYGSITLVRP